MDSGEMPDVLKGRIDKCSLLLGYKRRRECGSHGKERPRRPVCLEAHLRTEVMERISTKIF